SLQKPLSFRRSPDVIDGVFDDENQPDRRPEQDDEADSGDGLSRIDEIPEILREPPALVRKREADRVQDRPVVLPKERREQERERRDQRNRHQKRRKRQRGGEIRAAVRKKSSNGLKEHPAQPRVGARRQTQFRSTVSRHAGSSTVNFNVSRIRAARTCRG